MILYLPTITLIFSILALLLGLYGLWQIVSINRLRKSFFAGNRAVDLESVILGLKEDLREGREHQEILEQSLTHLRHDFTFSIQKLGLVRFNPFGDGGGNFSFSLVILDANNSGVVITSMYGREQNRIYTKQIDGGKCDVQLTEEELQAIRQADGKFQTSKTQKPKS